MERRLIRRSRDVGSTGVSMDLATFSSTLGIAVKKRSELSVPIESMHLCMHVVFFHTRQKTGLSFV